MDLFNRLEGLSEDRVVLDASKLFVEETGSLLTMNDEEAAELIPHTFG